AQHASIDAHLDGGGRSPRPPGPSPRAVLRPSRPAGLAGPLHRRRVIRVDHEGLGAVATAAATLASGLPIEVLRGVGRTTPGPAARRRSRIGTGRAVTPPSASCSLQTRRRSFAPA